MRKPKNKNGRNGKSPPKSHRWGKGQSGNPAGRPPSALSVTSTLKRMLEWEAPPDIVANFRQAFPRLSAKPTCLEIMVARSMIKSFDIKSGDVMAKEIWERLDGKVPFPIGPAPGSPPFRVKLDLDGLSKPELDILERLLKKCQPPEPTPE